MKYLFLILLSFVVISMSGFSQDIANIKVNSEIELYKINDKFYIHTTWFDFPGFGRYPSNGLVLLKNGKALLIKI